MTISFHTTKDELEIITKIAQRADREIYGAHVIQTISDTIMDIIACHANGCPLKLEALLAADNFNVAHDVAGIRRHIDCTTGKLLGGFLPRFSVIEVDRLRANLPPGVG